MHTHRLGLTTLVLACGVAAAALSFSSAASAEPLEKSGPFMANFKLGPAIEVSDYSETQFAIELDFGYAVAGSDGYLTFTPAFGFGDVTTIWLPVGFQYDIALPVDNLYIYPRLSAGFAHVTKIDESGGAVIPEVGLKYLITESFHAGFDPVSVPIGIGEEVWVQYRMAFYAGANF
jgi:hypothetical protein